MSVEPVSAGAGLDEVSEFGAGVVVCLAKFSEHLMWRTDRINDENATEDERSCAIEMWMNGASDHFYDLDRDKSPQPLLDLADLTLRIGHGFTQEVWTKETVAEIRRLWQDSCLAVDAMLHVDADWGSW